MIPDSGLIFWVTLYISIISIVSISIYSAGANSSSDAIRGATRGPVLLVHVMAEVKCPEMRFKKQVMCCTGVCRVYRLSRAAGWHTRRTEIHKKRFRHLTVWTWTPTNRRRRTLWRSSASKPATRPETSTAGSASNLASGHFSRNLTPQPTPR